MLHRRKSLYIGSRVVVSLLLAIALMCECGPSQRELTGEVFIVTKGGQSIKLGLVEVGLYSDKDINPFILQKLQAAKAQTQRLRPVKDNVEKEWQQLRNEENYLRGRYLDNMGSDAHKRRYDNAYESYIQKDNQYRKVLYDYLSYSTGQFYFSGMPKPIQSTKTDSDGKFSFRLTPGKYALAARASRKLFDSTEEYYWLVWISVKNDPTMKVMLSNDNLFETHCTDCVVKKSDLPY